MEVGGRYWRWVEGECQVRKAVCKEEERKKKSGREPFLYTPGRLNLPPQRTKSFRK